MDDVVETDRRASRKGRSQEIKGPQRRPDTGAASSRGRGEEWSGQTGCQGTGQGRGLKLASCEVRTELALVPQ